MKRKIIVIMSITVLIIMTGITVKAESSNTFKANVTTTKSTIKPGEDIIITLSVSDINMGTNGINALEGTVKYDTTIFEKIKSGDITSYNNWATTYNDLNSNLNGKFLAMNLSAGIKENSQVLSIKLKAKVNIEETKNTTITFEDISSNDGTDLINIGNKSINIKVEVEKQPIEEPRNEIENEVIDNILGEENETVENNTQTENKVTQNVVQNNNTHSNTKLPSTGIEDSIMPLIVIGVIIAIGLGMKCRKWRDIK